MFEYIELERKYWYEWLLVDTGFFDAYMDYQTLIDTEGRVGKYFF